MTETVQPKQAIKEQQAQRMEEILNPAGAGLLVIDMQRDFVSPDGKAAQLWHQNIAPMQAIIPTIEEIIANFRKRKKPVIFTKVYEDPELRTLAGQDRFIFFEEGDKETGVACLSGTPGAELYMKPEEDDIVIEKTRESALVDTRLHDILEREGIKTIYIAGVKTQRCILSTVRDLYQREQNLHVVTLADCIASDNIEQHNAALSEMKVFYPPVITSAVLKEAWTEK